MVWKGLLKFDLKLQLTPCQKKINKNKNILSTLEKNLIHNLFTDQA